MGTLLMQTVFIQCSEAPRAGLLDALGARVSHLSSVGQVLGHHRNAYHMASSAAQGFLDEVEYHSIMSRYKL